MRTGSPEKVEAGGRGADQTAGRAAGGALSPSTSLHLTVCRDTAIIKHFLLPPGIKRVWKAGREERPPPISAWSRASSGPITARPRAERRECAWARVRVHHGVCVRINVTFARTKAVGGRRPPAATPRYDQRPLLRGRRLHRNHDDVAMTRSIGMEMPVSMGTRPHRPPPPAPPRRSGVGGDHLMPVVLSVFSVAHSPSSAHHSFPSSSISGELPAIRGPSPGSPAWARAESRALPSAPLLSGG
ncbi:unnamed protein product [Arctogadus glacialis]